MKVRSLVVVLAGGFLMVMPPSRGWSSAQPQQEDHSPADGNGAYATGTNRNLFAEAGYPEAEVKQRIQTAFQQLFHGDPKTQAVYYAAGHNQNGDLAYVTDVAHHDVRTEGVSYGMMIAVETNHQSEFNALWNWANTYMLITDAQNPSQGYYAWSMHPDGTPNSDSPAPDGEAYFVMSLYFAAHRWGNGTGLYDYQAQADRILHLMRHHPVQSGMPPFRLHPGDPVFESEHKRTHAFVVGPMVNEAEKMLVFVPDEGGNGYTDPSYHLPAFFELWSRWGPEEDREFWAAAADASRRFFGKATDPKTGLVADYTNFDGTPKATSFNPMSAEFSYDSWRTVSNWSVDEAWWGKNPDARQLSDRIQAFLYAQGIHTFADQYSRSGKPLSNRHSTGMVATTAVGSLAAGKTIPAEAFVRELWNTRCPEGEQRYYDGLLYLMSLLHASGEFRIWTDAHGAGSVRGVHGE